MVKKNKVETACRIVHKPTGLKVEIDEQRTRSQNRRIALRRIEDKLKQAREKQKVADKKARRDEKIKTTKRIRTYDFKKGLVTN